LGGISQSDRHGNLQPRPRHDERPRAVQGRRCAGVSRTVRLPQAPRGEVVGVIGLYSERAGSEAPFGPVVPCDVGDRRMASSPWTFQRVDFSLAGHSPGGGVPCPSTTTSTRSTAFERTSKRRKGYPSENAREARTAGGAREQGARGEARAERSVPVRLHSPVSRTAACVAVPSTGHRAGTSFRE
jgi:hypothetical protein